MNYRILIYKIIYFYLYFPKILPFRSITFPSRSFSNWRKELFLLFCLDNEPLVLNDNISA